MEIKKEDREKLILGIQAAVGVAYIALALKESVKSKSPQMKKAMAKQAKRLDKLNRMEYKQEKKAIKRREEKEDVTFQPRLWTAPRNRKRNPQRQRSRR